MTFKDLAKKLGDMFLDQAGGVDEKRILGFPIIISAVIYVFITGNLSVFAAVAGLGTTLLLGAVAGDQGKLASTPPANSSAGVPGS